jgi:transcriptional regulator with XRE-family HTH domain
MYHLKLLAIARLVGLSQADIARHLGLTAVQVTRWAKGTRPLPPKHLDALWHLVYTAVEKFIELGMADVWPEGSPILATLTQPTPFRRQLETLLDELCLEFLERRGEGPSASIESTLIALDALPRDPQELQKPVNAAKLIELGRDLTFYGQLLSKITPLKTLLEDMDHANDARESDESGSAGTANAVDQ